jgi:L-alanine-DL-glutamate epimerase-like enolase superfamily enzyme
VSLSLAVETRRFRLAGHFTISRGARTEAVVVEARLSDGTATGRGECVPYARYGESVESVTARIEGLRAALADGLDREGLQGALPAGAARNALDCAFWDLAAKRAGRRVWELAEARALGAAADPGPEVTAYTLSLAAPEAMRATAAAHAGRPLLKVKLGGPGDLERLRAVREGAPRARLVIDANEGWDAATYAAIAPELVGLGVEMVEQPLPAGEDDALAGMARPLPVCADESCHDRASLPALAGKYDMVNVKLDKTGGLTEALLLRREAEAAGYAVMVGCMIGSSLAMAPAQLAAQGVAVVDLDAPLLLAEDRETPMLYEAGAIGPPPAALWG